MFHREFSVHLNKSIVYVNNSFFNLLFMVSFSLRQIEFVMSVVDIRIVRSKLPFVIIILNERR